MRDARASHASSAASPSVDASTNSLLRYANHEVIRELLRHDDGADDDFEGVDRRAREIESKLADVERRSIDEHAAECENLLELGGEVERCDAILGAMEKTLATFQSDLGRISSEIRDLQRESEVLRVKHANRAKAAQALGKTIASLTVEPELIDAIFRGDAGDESFVQGVQTLSAKLDALSALRGRGSTTSTSTSSAPPPLPARNDFAPALEKLRVKAVDRSWAFLYGEFASLKKPRTNVQLIQENSLAKYAPLIDFLRTRGPEVYWEVKSVYADTLGKILKTSMASYLESLKKVTRSPRQKFLLASKSPSTLASPVSSSEGSSFAANLAGMFSTISLSGSASSVVDDSEGLFTLGDRARSLMTAESAPPLVVHRESEKAPSQESQEYEELFRSAHRVLIDAATFEFAFCELFWKGEKDMFDAIFAAPLVAYNDFVAQTVALFSHDAIGLLIAIRVNNAHRRVMSRRRVPVLDAYIDNLNMILWPKFKQACDAHIKSLEDIRESFEPSPEAPNFVVKRYASFVFALTTIAHARVGTGSEEGDVASQVDVLLDRMRHAMFECLQSKFCASLKGSARARSAYLVRSYDYVCSTLSALAHMTDDADDTEQDGPEKPACTDLATLQFFESMLVEECKSFVAHALRDRFETIASLKMRIDSELQVRECLASFHRDWRAGLSAMYEDCVSCYGARGDWRAKELFRRAQLELVAEYGSLVGDGENEGFIRRELGNEFRDSLNDVVVTKPTFTLEANRLLLGAQAQA